MSFLLLLLLLLFENDLKLNQVQVIYLFHFMSVAANVFCKFRVAM